MTRKDLFGIIYVSVWIIAWGSVGSLIDYPLLENKIYQVGSIGQLSTFFISGILSSVMAILLFPKFTKKFIND